jgi:hypothetical protein
MKIFHVLAMTMAVWWLFQVSALNFTSSELAPVQILAEMEH